MCYVAPGPRCSPHAFGDLVMRTLDVRAAETDLLEAKNALTAWAQENPSMLAHPPVDLIAARTDAEVRLEKATHDLGRAKGDWAMTPHGMHTLIGDAAFAAGDMSPRQRRELDEARAEVFAIYSEYHKMRREKVQPSKAFKEKMKAAETRLYDATKDASALYLTKAARFMSQNPEKYGLDPSKPVTAQSLTLTDARIAEGLFNYWRDEADKNKMPQPQIAAHHLQNALAGATERSRRLMLMGSGGDGVRGGAASAARHEADGEHRDMRDEWEDVKVLREFEESERAAGRVPFTREQEDGLKALAAADF